MRLWAKSAFSAKKVLHVVGIKQFTGFEALDWVELVVAQFLTPQTSSSSLQKQTKPAEVKQQRIFHHFLSPSHLMGALFQIKFHNWNIHNMCWRCVCISCSGYSLLVHRETIHMKHKQWSMHVVRVCSAHPPQWLCLPLSEDFHFNFSQCWRLSSCKLNNFVKRDFWSSLLMCAGKCWRLN